MESDCGGGNLSGASTSSGAAPRRPSAWLDKRAELSAAFDRDCHALAKEFVAFQGRQLRDAINRYKTAITKQREADEAGMSQLFLIVDQKELNQMALSIRKMQEVGRMALGETTDRKQLDLPFDKMPNVQVTIVRERPTPANERPAP